MADTRLPHRAKPGLLHEICRFSRQMDGFERTDVYDRFDENKKTARLTIKYGVTLGFLEEDDGRFSLTMRGSGLGYQPSFEDSDAVADAFRESIEDYQPYRDAVLGVYSRDLVTEQDDEMVVQRTAFRTVLEEALGEEVEDRELNVLLKTAEAAGLGEYVAGRRGYKTRLRVNEGFVEFAEFLAERYTPPGTREGTEEGEGAAELEEAAEDKPPDGPEPTQQELADLGIVAGDGQGGRLTLTFELDVSDMEREEIAGLIERLRRGDI